MKMFFLKRLGVDKLINQGKGPFGAALRVTRDPFSCMGEKFIARESRCVFSLIAGTEDASLVCNAKFMAIKSNSSTNLSNPFYNLLKSRHNN